jgi:hypothetical protein
MPVGWLPLRDGRALDNKFNRTLAGILAIVIKIYRFKIVCIKNKQMFIPFAKM